MDKHFLTCISIQNFAVCLLLLNIFMVFPQNYAFADENTCYVDQTDKYLKMMTSWLKENDR